MSTFRSMARTEDAMGFSARVGSSANAPKPSTAAALTALAPALAPAPGDHRLAAPPRRTCRRRGARARSRERSGRARSVRSHGTSGRSPRRSRRRRRSRARPSIIFCAWHLLLSATGEAPRASFDHVGELFALLLVEGRVDAIGAAQQRSAQLLDHLVMLGEDAVEQRFVELRRAHRLCDLASSAAHLSAQAVCLFLQIVDGLADHLLLAGRSVEPLQDAAEEEALAEAVVPMTVMPAAVAVVTVPAPGNRREADQTRRANEKSEHRDVLFVRRRPLGRSEPERGVDSERRSPM